MHEGVDTRAVARWLAIRIAALPLIFILVSAASHFLLLGPLGEDTPERRIGGQGLTESQAEMIRDELHLGDPWIEQYGRWLADAVRGDLGRVYFADEPIGSELRRRFPPTAQLLLTSLFIATVIGAALAHGLRREGTVQAAAIVATSALGSIPIFITLTLAIIVPARLWSYSAPVGGYVGFINDPLVNFRLMFPASLFVGAFIAPTVARVLAAERPWTRGKNAWLSALFVAMVYSFPLTIGALIVAEQILSIDGEGQWFFYAVFLRELLLAHTLLTLVTFAGVSLWLLVPHRNDATRTPVTLARVPHRWLLLFGASIALLAAIVALVGPWLSPYDPRDLNVDTRFQGPSWEHWFGTNQLGQDQLSRLIGGLGDSLWFSTWVVALGVTASVVAARALAVAPSRYTVQIARFGRLMLGASALWWVLAVLATYGIRETPAGLAMALGVFVVVLLQLMERSTFHEPWSRTTIAENSLRVSMFAATMFASVLLLHATLTFYVSFDFIFDRSLSGEIRKGLADGVSYPHLLIFPGLTIVLLLFAFNLVATTLLVSESAQLAGEGSSPSTAGDSS